MFKKLKRLLSILIAIIVVGVPLLFILHPKGAAAWYDENWLYRKAITVTVTSSASDITDLETLVTIDTSLTGKFQASCQDLRFTSTSGNLLPYYIDSGCTTSSTKVWVMIDLVPKNSTTYTMYMYYGNPSAPAGSDSSKFRLFNGLVGYWAMNETSWNGTAGEVKDNSVNGNNGQAYGNATTTSSGKYSYAGSFDGNNDYVLVNNSSSLDITGNITISLWVNKISQINWASLLYKATTNSDPGSKYAQYGLGISDTSKIFTNFGNGTDSGYFTGNTTINTSTWYHVAATYNGSQIVLYVNGQVDGSLVQTGSLYSNSYNLHIGHDIRYSDSRFLNGNIDDVRIYNRALSASEISQLYSNPGNIASNVNATVKPTTSAGSEEAGSGPVGYWKFDDGQGTNAQDSSSSNNDGTLSGATLPTWQTEDQCISGKCLYFDGSTSYVDLGTSSSLNFERTNSFTLQAWVKKTGNYHQVILSKMLSSGTYRGWFLWFDDDGSVQTVLRSDNSTNNYIEVDTQNTFQNNTWYLLTLTYNGSSAASGVKIYVNGLQQTVNVGQDSLSGTIQGVVNTNIGARDSGVSPFHGFIDEPKIYPYARTAAQIKSDYAQGFVGQSSKIGQSVGAGSSRPNTTTGELSNGLVGYWKLDEASGNAVDSSGNGNTGTWNGTGSHYPAGKFGNGGGFNGTDDYVDLGTGSSINPSTQYITLSAWVKTIGAAPNGTIIGKRNVYASANDYTFDASGPLGILRFEAGNNSTFAQVGGTIVVADTNWHHVVFILDTTQTVAADRTKFYVDGKQDVLSYINIAATQNSTLTLSTSIKTAIGARQINTGGVNFFTGQIDEVRIYNRALSPKEVSDLYNFAPGPKVNLKMEEGTGTSANDSSGNSNNGTVNSGTWTQGKYGKGVNLNGTSGSNVSVPDFAY